MAEAVAFVLGVIPLLISAAEHYEDCLQPFVRYRNFTSIVDQFQQRLNIQRTVFRNECRILLESVVEHEIASRMLEDKNHVLWADKSLDQQLVQQLQSSKDTCVTIVSLIKEHLIKIEKESESLSFEAGQGSVTDKAWRSHVKRKLKFSFSRSKLADNLAELKALNDDFRTLSAQTSKLRDRSPSVPRQGHKPNRDVRKFQLIQKASQKVYEALGKSCTKHTEHLTHFCLDAVAIENDNLPQVQFRLAFTHLPLQGSVSKADPVWFMIESIVGGDTEKHLELAKDSQSLVQTLKRSGEDHQEVGPKKVKKSVRFQSTVISASRSLVLPTGSDAPLQNLCMRKNFCDQLRICLRQSPQIHTCLGTLDDTDCYKHLIYFPPSPAISYGRRPAASLEHVISTLSKQGPLARLSQHERFRLAHSLSTAVLQYHATPWLQGSWKSDDIYFFGFDETLSINHVADLSPPHLNVSVKGPDGALSRASNFPPRAFAPNALLFGLGVLLLEIGYTATLESLKRPSDIENGENKYTEFFLAKRLASSISREMGSTYGRIVNKCLYCDFGCGQDLSDHELQEGYYQDVVQELKKLEDEFKEMEIAP